VTYRSAHGSVETVTVTRSTGVQFAANPKILVNDDLVRPLNAPTGSVAPTSKLANGSANRAGSNSSTVTVNVVTATLPDQPGASITSAMRHSQSSSYSARVNRSRAIRVSFLLVTAYIVCWLPYNGLSLIQFVNPDIFHKHANKVYCLHGMIVFNSVINPYLYGLFGGLCRPSARDVG